MSAMSSSAAVGLRVIQVLVIVGMVLTLAVPSRANDELIAAARATITAQIDAFKRDDGQTAYSFAAPEVQRFFPTPDVFMDMVKGGYQPVYRPQSYSFQPGQVDSEGGITQAVDIVGPDGEFWVAEYTLRKMSDGSVKIASCRLIKRDGVGA